MFGKLLMKISEKMEEWIQKKPEEKVPVDIERNDLKNQEDLSTTESDTIKLWDYGDGEFLKPRDKILQNIFPGSVPGILMINDSKILNNTPFDPILNDLTINKSDNCFLDF
jgi:hypothetical protein